MELVTYVTDDGTLRLPAELDPAVGWWRTATHFGRSLGTYTSSIDGQRRVIIQDRGPSDRRHLGLSTREVRAIELEHDHPLTAIAGRGFAAEHPGWT